MRTQYYTATSMDGFIADPDDGLEWLLQLEQSAEVERRYAEFLAATGALVMGSTTYHWILREVLRGDPSRWPYTQPTWVFSSKPQPSVEGHDIRFVSGPVEPVQAAIAAEVPEGQNLWLVGGGELVGQFLDAGFLDDVLLGVAPVLLGAGAPLLPRRVSDPPLRLVDATAAGPFALLTYTVPRPGD
jgi:dihydrofolate reductase